MKYAHLLSTILKKIGGLSLLGMMLLTCADVVGSIFGKPILGAEELVALWASILLAFSLPAAHIENANVGVELLHMKMSRRVKRINDCCVAVASFALFLLITWQCYLYAKELRAAGEVTMTLQFPAYLLIFAVSFALLTLTAVIFLQIFNILKSEAK